MKTVLNIKGMSCDHCVRHVTEALEEVAGVQSVLVSLKENTAAVEHPEGLSPAALKDVVAEAGYEVV
ncbi:MAG: cation transporter [Treponema sp.]|nr:cation transporter [Treponema sp.]